jgi:DNA-directed RNA polymerase subunit E"
MAKTKSDSRSRKAGSNLKACRECHSLLEGTVCPICQSTALIIDPGRSEIAHLMNVKRPGKFALKVR